MTEKYALQEAAEKYLITLAAHRANTRDISAVENWDKATSEFMALVDNDELNIIASLFNELKTNKQNIKTLESRNRRLEGIIDAAEKRIAEQSSQKRLIGWRSSDYTDETSDPELAKNWAVAIGVLPIFEGDVNTKLSAAGIGNNGGSNVT